MNIRRFITKRMVAGAAAAIAIASVALPGATGVFESAPVSANGVDNAIFLMVDGVDGAVKDRSYYGSISILSVSHGIERPASDSGSARGQSKAVFGDMVLEKEVDNSTTKLQEAVATGKVFPRVEIHMTSTYGTSRQTYLMWELKNVRVRSYSVSGATDGGRMPTEEVTMSYDGYRVVHTDYAPDGSSSGNTEFNWNVEEGAK